MKILQVHDKQQIYDYMIRNKALNIYSIGDLDDFFWPHTTWYALTENNEIKAMILLYTGLSEPTVLALSDNIALLTELFQNIADKLPARFYAHLSYGVFDKVKNMYNNQFHGQHYKMNLIDWQIIESYESFEVEQMTPENLDELLEFYAEAYPGNWFDSRMLSTNHYYAVRKDHRIASVAGVHVYSADYKVAALGNIATHPDYRGMGLGYQTTAFCCKNLVQTVTTIGLNVSQTNPAAISLYKKLGFEIAANYEEHILEKKS